jgi:hypothetical protein
MPEPGATDSCSPENTCVRRSDMTVKPVVRMTPERVPFMGLGSLFAKNVCMRARPCRALLVDWIVHAPVATALIGAICLS